MSSRSNIVEQTSIDISSLPKNTLATSIIEKLPSTSPSLLENSIYRVPRKLRQGNENVFDPIIVSIGPFHHDTKRLAPMEDIKFWYLECLLNRFQSQFQLPREKALEDFVENIRVLQKDACKYYADPINFDDDKFIEMMIVDGCFLLELFRRDAFSVPRDKDDPIFDSPSMLEYLYRDLILLENQIPWLVLQNLFELTMSFHEQESNFLVVLVLKFFEKKMLMTRPASNFPNIGRETGHTGSDQKIENEVKVKHILDLLHRSILSSSSGAIRSNQRIEHWQQLPPLTDLLHAGIKFKKGSTPDDIFGIKFTDGVFEIPPISIQSNSKSLFQNLIAYEQCNRHFTRQFTSYAVFLDCLVNTTKDVNVLLEKEIIHRHGISTEDTSSLFNSLYCDTIVHTSYYGQVSQDAYQYYKSRWRRWISTFLRVYCANPWTVSSVVAASLVLLFTGTQTVFGILSYVNM